MKNVLMPSRSMTRKISFAAILLTAALALSSARAVNVLTQHNDNSRTGANTSETILTVANVNTNQFGKLWSYSVDGQVYAQILYVQGVSIAGGNHNVIYVCTEHNSVYAFDADSNTPPLWHVNLGAPVTDQGCADLVPEIGITGTPVIDLSSGTLYVDAKTVSDEGSHAHKLHALDIATGSEKFGGPVTVSASVNGKTLDPFRHHQRAGLLLLNGAVYVAFGSHCDTQPYYGWLLAYNTTNLSQTAVFNTARNGSQSAIWQSGMGPAADSSGNIYIITGNGSWDGSTNFGESFVKLSSNLSVVDWFTPANWATFNANDTDLGSGGPVLLPTHFVVGLGKDGNIYLCNRNHMGHLDGSVQTFPAMANGDTVGMAPVYWRGPSKQYLFFKHSNDKTKSFEFTGSKINVAPLGIASVAESDRAGGLSLSANGTSNGILWEIGSDSTLRAYDAINFPALLWDSGQNSMQDSIGSYVKFNAPTIANGKVYAPASGKVTVYGLFSKVNK